MEDGSPEQVEILLVSSKYRYTEEQAARELDTYKKNVMICHAITDENEFVGIAYTIVGENHKARVVGVPLILTAIGEFSSVLISSN